MNQTQVKVQIPKEFRELFNKWRYIALWGGRASGKSVNTALALLLKGRNEKLRILCTRQIQNTIRDSVHKLLKDLISKYEFSDYVVNNENIVNRVTGTEFIFKGLLRNIGEIKSLEGIDIAWCEEAQSVTDDSLNILTPTIRKEGSQIIFTFNRINELDPVYVRYVMNKPPETYEKKINYDVLERLKLLPETVLKEINYDKQHDPELYAHKWLGEPLSQSDKAIMSRIDVLNAMNRVVADEGQIEVGVDVARMGDDRTVFFKRKGLKVVDFQIYSKLRTHEVFARLLDYIGQDKQINIKVDDTGVGGGLTDMLIQNGYSVTPINFGGQANDKDKYPNVISEGWFYLKSLLGTIQLPNNSDLLMELTSRQYKVDNKGRLCIESKDEYKKRGFRSPDLADALILCFINYNNFNIKTDLSFV